MYFLISKNNFNVKIFLKVRTSTSDTFELSIASKVSFSTHALKRMLSPTRHEPRSTPKRIVTVPLSMHEYHLRSLRVASQYKGSYIKKEKFIISISYVHVYVIQCIHRILLLKFNSKRYVHSTDRRQPAQESDSRRTHRGDIGET